MTSEGVTPVSIRTVVISENLWSSFGFAPSFLRRANVRLVSARTGSEVLSLAGASDPALFLLEYGSPLMGGDEVCRQIRASRKLRKVPVIIVGPPEPPEIQAACEKAGCSLFVPGPVDFPGLLPRLAELLGVLTREDERIPVVLSVSYGTVTSELLGHSLDLSAGGIQVRTRQPLREGFYITLRFSLEEKGRPIVAPGRITRVSPTDADEYDVGVRFLALPLESLERLQKFLERRSG